MAFPLLNDLIAVFCLSIVVLLFCYRVRVPAIVGFLITGVLCGPSALGLVEDAHSVELLAEIGVVMLLFTIGLELSGEELLRMSKAVFIGGSLQVVLAIGIFAGVMLLLGSALPQAITVGFLGALSSTAIVLTLLQRLGQAESPQGRISLSVLIFQDIVIVPMMLLIPLLAGAVQAHALSLLISAGRTVLILGGVWLLARFVVPRMMKLVMKTRSRELLLMSTLGLCLAVAVFTSSLGLSLALGAFMAGLLLAGSEYSLSVMEGILPFRDVFTSLFFISVGMLLDIQFFFTHFPTILLLAVGIIVLKAVMVVPAVRVLGYPLRTCIIVGFCLAQVGEFSFVLAREAMTQGLLDDYSYQLFLAASILTMIATPWLISLAPKTAAAIVRKLGRPEALDVGDAADEGDQTLQDHLIIIGFGVGGKALAHAAKEAGIPYIILEMNPDTVSRYRDREPIHHGDASHALVLMHLGIQQARVFAVVISDPTAVRSITAQARKLNPDIYIVLRTRFLGEVQELRRLGASDVVPEEFETSIEVFTRVLSRYLVPQQTIEHFVQRLRGENYGMMRQIEMQGTSIDSMGDALPGLEVSVCIVEEGSPYANTPLAQLDMRQKHGVTIVAISRANQIIAPPAASEVMLPGDQIYLFGLKQDVQAIMPELRKAVELEEGLF